MFIETLATDPIFFLRVVIILIISVSLHELAHGWAALSQGDDTPARTGHMTLNPVVHMGWTSIIFLCLAGIVWGQMPVNPSKFRSLKWGNILVSAAGPFCNFILAFLAVLVIDLSTHTFLGNILSLSFFSMAARINFVLFLFNLLPIPPLDGFHVLSEFVPTLKPWQNSPLGLIAFMILFTSDISLYLFDAADIIIDIMTK